MENNFNPYKMKLPNQNFVRNDSFNSNKEIKNKQPFTSLDGRKWTTKDQEFRANQEYYRNNLNNTFNK